MKTVVIFTRTIDAAGYPFSDDYHWNAYIDLLLEIKKRGAAAYFATDNATYSGSGIFSTAYSVDAKVPVSEFAQHHDVKADLVFEKGGFTGRDVPVLNPEYVHKITSDKAETYRHFAKYQPYTVICDDAIELDKAFEAVQSDFIVVKAPVSNMGQAVTIGPKAEVRPRVGQEYPLIVQEFIDTSVGIKNYVEGIHDVRVKIGGGRIFGGMIRTPAPGEYRANLAQGGTARHLLPEEIPPEAVELALEIDRDFADYPRYYALDFANTAQGMKLIELNSKPGLAPMSTSPESRKVTQMLADYLIAIA